MGVDDVLLTCPAPAGEYTLRFYRWARPTVSLGYAQPWRSGFDPVTARRYGMAVVRRRTGGRAVLHAGELTYAIAGPSESGPLAGGIQATYQAVAEGLVEGLRALGLEAGIVRSRGRRASEEPSEPGACFGARALNELVAEGRKIVGSAQRRAGGRVLQHGSILVDRPDPRRWEVLGEDGAAAAAESAGLAELLGSRPGWRSLSAALATGVAWRLGMTSAQGRLSATERRVAACFAAVYRDERFTRRR